ncbi:MAG: TIGR01440 family protein [Clostridia bacterium]
MDFQEITNSARRAAEILVESGHPKIGEIFVVGCSTSEVMGKRIGSASNEDAAAAIMDGILPIIMEAGLHLAVQGCEHINRALCVPRVCMERYDLQEVWVRPWLHAGGAFATEAYKRIMDAVMVEDLRGRASLGIDIGGTLIGMHLHPVVVPVHTDLRNIGSATVVLARCRPKYVGGPRAQYDSLDGNHR